ncbi:MAG: 5'-nucleotidase [Gammaproteobacteria bacterium WSBS_2016_MAG_OTU1]
MSPKKTNKKSAKNEPSLVVAVSSRALFDFEKEHEFYKENDAHKYTAMQFEKLNEPAAKGVAYSLAKKLLSFNSEDEELVRLVVMSRNAPAAGLRVFRSAAKYKLKIESGCFTRGESPFPYLAPFGAHLFLSAYEPDVKDALNSGIPAAHVLGGMGGKTNSGRDDDILRIAFDGDAVLFSDESEIVFQEEGLDAFREREHEKKNKPLSPGPLKPFLEALINLRNRLNKTQSERIRIALITARGAPAHERPIQTLISWGIDIDEAFFMNGQRKQDVVEKFGADFFFDDQVKHVAGVSQGGHVPYGITNSDNE